MGNGMNKILPGLYVGSVRDSKDQEQLRLNNITHIIAIHDNARRGQGEEIEYLCILASDKPDQNLSQFFAQCNDFIHQARLQNGNVLIHCLAGVSRSVTIAVAYLMSVTSLNWKDGLKCVRGARAIANPNFGFQKQLQDFEGRRLREERKRLSIKFPNNVFRPEDEKEVRKLILVYESLQSSSQDLSGTSRSASASLNNSPSRKLLPSTSGSPEKGPFSNLAPGRSPVMKKRTLPTPHKNGKAAKTI
ncbi:protein-tyrosine phosphatase-like protein [Dinothrombium tinctorium]|uniref:Dual specificity protein phosphatase 15 n=1 Tax=Dinothrombium tinctorium TaxID=1965070 RepID=A0A443RRY4_9ACAR|nr:protein-tyrosine phosphatase-like protein [Dinothrombium tinctorium]